MCYVTKRKYVSFKVESTQSISQLKYRSYSNDNNDIFDTLRANHTFLRMKKYDSQTKASIWLFLGIHPKLTLRKALKNKIDDIITCLDIDDDDTKLLMEEKTAGDSDIQEISTPVFDIYITKYSALVTVKKESPLQSTRFVLHLNTMGLSK